MKTIGLLGGMSWQSTSHYYRLLNQGVASRLGGLHSARIILLSVDFHPLEERLRAGDWAACGKLLGEAAMKVAAAGADLLLICTNTMHKLAPEIAASLPIPLLHIADPTGEKIVAQKIKRVGLLGTRFTMEEEFYRQRLAEGFGLEVLIPEAADRQLVDRVIFSELCRGVVSTSAKEDYQRIIAALGEQGAEAVIAGCTEITMLVSPEESPLPLFDTTALHAAKAVELALRDEVAAAG
jgi:aspartate racemase